MVMFIKVKVFPSSKKKEMVKKSPSFALRASEDKSEGKEDSFEIKVKEKPIKGDANKAVVKLLSDYFNLPAGRIRLIKGAKQRNKIFEINK